MRPAWKYVGLAGLAGVAATGVVVARRRRAQRDYDPDELRAKLHRRLAESGEGEPAAGEAAEDGPADVGGGERQAAEAGPAEPRAAGEGAEVGPAEPPAAEAPRPGDAGDRGAP